MKKHFAPIALVLAVIAAPVLAGEEEHKCTADTQTCLNYFAQKMADRGWAGVNLDHGEEGQQVVIKVYDDTPAQAAGVLLDDVLVAINGIELNEENGEKLQALQGKMKPGAEFSYTIVRNGKEKEIALTLAKMPEEVIASMVGRHMIDQHATVEIASN